MKSPMASRGFLLLEIFCLGYSRRLPLFNLARRRSSLALGAASIHRAGLKAALLPVIHGEPRSYFVKPSA
jgi:hypothetical protein